MLTAKESDKRPSSESTVSREDVLKFASQNQQLEGFPGEISEAARQHRPNWEELEAVARRFGSQMPQRPAETLASESIKTPR
jgi:hypothetical protein